MRIVSNKTSHWQWFHHGFGRFIAKKELDISKKMITNILGDFAVQTGRKNAILYSSSIRHQVHLGKKNDMLKADWTELPLANSSIDLFVLSHSLEASDNAKTVLREAVRVLRPEGRLIIIGFNPWSLLAISRLAPWRKRWLSVRRVNDWLSLLEMEPIESRYAVFLPPWKTLYRHKKSIRWIEKAGQRWWPLTGSIYILHTIKRRRGLRLILPSLPKTIKQKKLVGVSAEKLVQ